MWEKKYRMRWKTSDNSIVSAWTPNNYPSYSAIRDTILYKKICIELEHLETYERVVSKYFDVSDIQNIKYLNIVVDGGHYGCVAVGLDDEKNTEWFFCDNTSTIEANNVKE